MQSLFPINSRATHLKFSQKVKAERVQAARNQKLNPREQKERQHNWHDMCLRCMFCRMPLNVVLFLILLVAVLKQRSSPSGAAVLRRGEEGRAGDGAATAVDVVTLGQDTYINLDQ